MIGTYLPGSREPRIMPVLTKKTFQIESIQIDLFINRLQVLYDW